jgi:DMSO/TMAO reductase YedYZ molybdopterin-dependent catalytic subunit
MVPPPTTPTPIEVEGLLPGEVTHYQNYSLTPISAFEEDIAQHPDVAIMGTQYLNEATYRLEITGLVKTPLNYTYDDVVNNFPSYQQVSTLLCVEGWSVTTLWEGASVTDLIQSAGVSPSATVAIFYGSDGYTSALPLSYIAQNNIILAYKINNVTLPPATGFPLALVATNQYGYKWVKWVTEIEVSNDTGYLGYWESRGYPNNATIGTSDGSLSNPYEIAEIIGFSAVAIVVAVACYIIMTKVRKTYSSREDNKQISV